MKLRRGATRTAHLGRLQLEHGGPPLSRGQRRCSELMCALQRVVDAHELGQLCLRLSQPLSHPPRGEQPTSGAGHPRRNEWTVYTRHVVVPRTRNGRPRAPVARSSSGRGPSTHTHQEVSLQHAQCTVVLSRRRCALLGLLVRRAHHLRASTGFADSCVRCLLYPMRGLRLLLLLASVATASPASLSRGAHDEAALHQDAADATRTLDTVTVSAIRFLTRCSTPPPCQHPPSSLLAPRNPRAFGAYRLLTRPSRCPLAGGTQPSVRATILMT